MDIRNRFSLQLINYRPFQGVASVEVYYDCHFFLASIEVYYLDQPRGHLLGNSLPLGFWLVLFCFVCIPDFFSFPFVFRAIC